MLKIQTYDPALGWIMRTRAGRNLRDAWPVLAAYRRDWPGEVHRLVIVDSKGGAVGVPDDPEALKRAGKAHAAQRASEASAAPGSAEIR